jgi:2-polyprenyl-6-methoxyphenol hydroxylase-like FAD-dependent oxidoreductase
MKDSRPKTNRNVLIIGAGIGGPTLAFWLRRYSFTPTLIEKAPAFRDGGYMLDVWGVGYDLIERMGLLEAAREKAYTIDRLCFVDGTGRRIAGLDGDVLHHAFGERFFSIPRGDLARVIYDTVASKVETIYATSIGAIREDETGVDVEFANGASRRFDLVIGADGLRSRVRECVFPAERQFERYLGYYATSFVANDYPYRDDRTYLTFARPGRQISRYSMRNGQSAFLMVFAEDEKLPIAPHDSPVFKMLLREKFGRDGWECREILARLDAASDVYFDAVSQIQMPQWSRGRVALVGDAAYCPSLLAGAGSAYAMLGAYVLAGELKMSNDNHRAAFAAYEERLRTYMESRQKTAANFARAFAPRTALGIFLRNRVLLLMRIPLLGGWLARFTFANAIDLSNY